MPIPEKFRKAITQEFVGFYNLDVLPPSWDEWLKEKLDRAATVGAARMRYRIASTDVSELAAFLRAESQNRQGELVREIESLTSYSWGERDKAWNALQRLLNALADKLEAQEK
jgi:hypothetical protein